MVIMQIRDLLNSTDEQETKTTSKKALFVIEGVDCDTKFTAQFSPEISAAIKLAKANNCEMIDIISSFDEKHLAALFQGADETKLKKIILCILLEHKNFTNPGAIIYEKIKSRESLIGKSVFENFPTWLEKLEENEIQELIEFLQNELAEGVKVNYEEFSQELTKELEHICLELQSMVNEISAKNLMEYLLDHPEIEVVYGLLGNAHLPILNMIGNVIESADGYVHGEIPCNNQLVKIHLFGGRHGQIQTYENLSRQTERDGFIVPVHNEPVSDTFSFFSRAKGFDSERLQSEGMALLSSINQLLPQVRELGEEFDELCMLSETYLTKLDRVLCLSPTNLGYLNYLETELKQALKEGAQQVNSDDETFSVATKNTLTGSTEKEEPNEIHSPLAKKSRQH